jgi:hypothetical protein
MGQHSKTAAWRKLYILLCFCNTPENIRMQNHLLEVDDLVINKSLTSFDGQRNILTHNVNCYF